MRYCSHDMVLRSKSRSNDALFHRVEFGSISFNLLKYGAPVDINAQPFDGFVMLEFPVQGCSMVRYGEQSVMSTDDQAVVISTRETPSSRWQPDTTRLMVQINYGTIERFLCELLGHGVNNRIEFSLGLDTSASFGKGIRDYVFYLANQVNENDYIQKNQLVREEMGRGLISLLICGQPNNYSEHISAKVVPGNPKYIERAREYIRENYHCDLKVSDLVEVSGVSLRTLYAGFRRYLGTSPMLAIKTARLNSVRACLMNNEKNQSITYISSQHGFMHMGNFSKDYYRQFGEKPSETLILHQ